MGRGRRIKPATMSFAWNVAEARVHRGANGELLVWRPVRGVLVTRLTGHADVDFLHFYTTHAEREMQAGPIRVFHDWSALVSYDAAARDRLKIWGRDHNPDFVAVHYLVRHKIISMLISVAALTIGRDLFGTTDRPQFLRDLEAALRGR